MSSLSEEPDLDADVAEPFRFHFEVAYEVANKGVYVRASAQELDLVGHLRAVVLCLCVSLSDLGACRHEFEALRRAPLGVSLQM